MLFVSTPVLRLLSSFPYSIPFDGASANTVSDSVDTAVTAATAVTGAFGAEAAFGAMAATTLDPAGVPQNPAIVVSILSSVSSAAAALPHDYPFVVGAFCALLFALILK